MASRQSGENAYPSSAVNHSNRVPNDAASTQQSQSYNGQTTHRGQLNLPASQTAPSRSHPHPPSPLGQPPMLARQPSTAELSSLVSSNTDPNNIDPGWAHLCERFSCGSSTEEVRDLEFTKAELEDTELDADDHAILKKKHRSRSVSMRSLRRVKSNLISTSSLFGRSSLRVKARSTQSQLSVIEVSSETITSRTEGHLEHSDYYQNQTPSSDMQLSAINRNSTDSQEVRIRIPVCALQYREN
jgi:hypothetical protein